MTIKSSFIRYTSYYVAWNGFTNCSVQTFATFVSEEGDKDKDAVFNRKTEQAVQIQHHKLELGSITWSMTLFP